jgi:type IV secretion system protein VirD4
MSLNNDLNAGDIVRACANEIVGLMKSSEREYGSVISSAQKYTDFLKSPALRQSLVQSDKFTSADLASGNVTVYVIISAERLKSHSQWLRLVVTSLMRAVVRDPQKDVCFLLDEFYALGYLSEIDVALGSYAGFGVHIWAILQNLTQLNELYKENWENFISSCSVRHFFNISDNFSADYLSQMFGQTSMIEYDDKGNVSGATARPLVTSDELRRQSGEIIYTVIDQLAPAQTPKVPYYQMGLDADTNPYYKPDGKNPQQTTVKLIQETVAPPPPLPPMPQLPPGWKMKFKEPKK